MVRSGGGKRWLEFYIRARFLLAFTCYFVLLQWGCRETALDWKISHMMHVHTVWGKGDPERRGEGGGFGEKGRCVW